MQAHERLELLKGRVSAVVVESAAAELERMAREADWSVRSGVGAFDDVVDAVRHDQSMAGDLRRAMTTLRSRIVDADVVRQLEALDGRLAVGVTADGQLSAAVFAYPDKSFLVLVDHSLMLCIWLAAQIAVALRGHEATPDTAGNGIAVDDGLAAIRLALARPAVGARAGLLPPLLLAEPEMALAASLTAEIDQFLLAHELGHVLLGHFTDQRRALGALVGPSTTADNTLELEHAADLVALTLVLEDIDHGRVGTEHLALRLAALRLGLVPIDNYERTCFVLQPTSHPPAAERFAFLRARALEPWFGSHLEDLLRPFTDLVRALASPPTEDLAFAVGRVDRGLGGRLDRALWDATKWADLAQLGGLVVPRPATARRALGHAFSWRCRRQSACGVHRRADCRRHDARARRWRAARPTAHPPASDRPHRGASEDTRPRGARRLGRRRPHGPRDAQHRAVPGRSLSRTGLRK